MIDLHTHTTCSDGDRTPCGIVELCKESGIDVVAITDHDTVDGIEEAQHRGTELGITVVPGIEMSTEMDGQEIHLVGLFVDPHNQELLQYCKWANQQRDERGRKMIAKLRQQGVEFTQEEEEQSCSSRARIGMLLVKKQVVPDMRAAFRQYLGREGSVYVDKERIPIAKAIKVIHQAGGLAILAHLSTISNDENLLREKVARLQQAGLDGIESYYSEYSWSFSRFCQRLAEEKGLAQSGGSDFHGSSKKGLKLGRGYGGLNIPRSAYQGLLERL